MHAVTSGGGVGTSVQSGAPAAAPSGRSWSEPGSLLYPTTSAADRREFPGLGHAFAPPRHSRLAHRRAESLSRSWVARRPTPSSAGQPQQAEQLCVIHAASQTPPAFARYNQGSRSSLGSIPRRASPSLSTSPSTPRCEPCAAMTTRFLRGRGLVGKGRGRKRRGRWLPRQIDIDQVSDEESGRGRNRPIRSLPVRDFCSGAYTHGRPVLFPWLSHHAPSEVLLKRKPRGQSRHAISEFVEIKFRLDGG
jgi:hypothetical protein